MKNLKNHIALMPFILECQNKIIGTILCGHDGRRGCLHHFVVHMDFQGHGLGQGLYYENEIWTKSHSIITRCTVF